MAKGEKARLLATKLGGVPVYAPTGLQTTVHFIRNAQEWTHCASKLLTATVLGFDTETRPVFGKNRPVNPTSIFQIAMRNASGEELVFVLDLLSLPVAVYNKTLSKIFLDKSVLKLGQSFYQDLQELSAAYPNASCFTVVKNVVEVNDLSVLAVGGHRLLSLQKLVFLYLGRKLAKTQQMSNWNRRPLSASQLHYAAADALVLIHVYDAITNRFTELEVSRTSRVLDVHTPRPPRCHRCLTEFETQSGMKEHEKQCPVPFMDLHICSACLECSLLSIDQIKEHAAGCGVEPRLPPVAQKTSKVGKERVAGKHDKKSKKLEQKATKEKKTGSKNTDNGTKVKVGVEKPSGGQKRRNQKKGVDRGQKQQKVPTTNTSASGRRIEEQTLQSDDLWQQIARDQAM